MILRLIASLLGGLAGHSFHRPTQKFGPRWGSMLRYSIGYMLCIPFVAMVYSSLRHDKTDPDEINAIIVSMLLTGGGFGTGVFIGYLVDDLRRRND